MLDLYELEGHPAFADYGRLAFQQEFNMLKGHIDKRTLYDIIALTAKVQYDSPRVSVEYAAAEVARYTALNMYTASTAQDRSDPPSPAPALPPSPKTVPETKDHANALASIQATLSSMNNTLTVLTTAVTSNARSIEDIKSQVNALATRITASEETNKIQFQEVLFKIEGVDAVLASHSTVVAGNPLSSQASFDGDGSVASSAATVVDELKSAATSFEYAQLLKEIKAASAAIPALHKDIISKVDELAATAGVTSPTTRKLDDIYNKLTVMQYKMDKMATTADQSNKETAANESAAKAHLHDILVKISDLAGRMDLISPIHEKVAYLVGNKWECSKCLHVNIGDAHSNCIGCGDPKAQTKSTKPSTADSLNNISIGIQSVQDKMIILSNKLKSNTQQTAEALRIAKKLSVAADIADVRRSIHCRQIIGMPLELERLVPLLENDETDELDLTYFEDSNALRDASSSELIEWAQLAAQCEEGEIEPDYYDNNDLEQVVRLFLGLDEA